MSAAAPHVPPVNWAFPLLYTPALLPFVAVGCATLAAFRRSIPAGQSWAQPFSAAVAKCKSERGLSGAEWGWGKGTSACMAVWPAQGLPADLLKPCPPAGVAPAIIGALILVALMVQGGRQVPALGTAVAALPAVPAALRLACLLGSLPMLAHHLPAPMQLHWTTHPPTWHPPPPQAPSYIVGYWLSEWLGRGYIAVSLL